MNNAPEIGVATEQDLDALTGLMAAFRDYLGQSDPSNHELHASITHLLTDKDTEFLVVRSQGGALLGYAQLRYRYSAWVSGLEAQLEDLYIVLPARGIQVGTRLLHGALARAAHRGARVVGLNTNECNAMAVRLYRRAGFVCERGRWEGGRQLWFERPLEGMT